MLRNRVPLDEGEYSSMYRSIFERLRIILYVKLPKSALQAGQGQEREKRGDNREEGARSRLGA